jgi:hypothetical protein
MTRLRLKLRDTGLQRDESELHISAYPTGLLLRLAMPHDLTNERGLLRGCHLNGRQDCDRANLVPTGIFCAVESRACLV